MKPVYACLCLIAAATLSAREVELANGVRLSFAERDGVLLGLNTATVDGVVLSSPDTVQFPVLAEEFNDDRMIWPFLRLDGVVEDDGAIELRTTLLGTTSEEAYRRIFVFTGDLAKAAASDLPRELAEQKRESNAAAEKLEALVREDADFQKRLREIEELKALENPGRRERAQLENLTSERAMRKQYNQAERRTLEGSAEARALMEEARKFENMLGPWAVEHFGDLHRDYYEFAHLRLPADIARLSARREALAALKDQLQPGGTLVWRFEPAERNIAGWIWKGWKQSISFELPQGRKVNAIRTLGTWEIDGAAPGLTTAALRYRGLGRIEQAFTDDGQGGVNEAWTTTEILPGAVGGAPLVSPVVPSSESVNDRGYALRHRAGAWICRMARGAGAPFVDFQFRPHAALISFHERQGNLRGLSEAFPGDPVISYTDEQIFALAGEHAAEPQVYLALVDRETPFTLGDMRTRWKEVDQNIRDLVGGELGYRPVEPVPGVGILYENGRPNAFQTLADSTLAKWAEQGVRIVVNHAPGWYSDQHKAGWDQPRTPGGNSNRISDWRPTKDVEEAWKALSRKAGELGIAYYAYMTGMSNREKEFVAEVGADIQHWGVNKPGNDFSSGYPPQLLGHNPLDARFMEIFPAKIESVQREYGFQGIWADSFQNMYMSQLNWGNGTGNSTQRAWWELIAKWSRQGIHWMSESHAFPGWSCSIEVPNWELDPFYFQHVWKWLRGTAQKGYTGEQLDRLTFRIMANKGWLGPDMSYDQSATFSIPSFKRLAGEYMAALPTMRRPWVLDDDRGVVWLPYDRADTGVWFSFKDQTVPSGVSATPILGGDAVESLSEHHTYTLRADDLPKALGLRTGPAEDPRTDKTYTPNPWQFFE